MNLARRILLRRLVEVVGLAWAVAACTANSPTAPSPGPANPAEGSVTSDLAAAPSAQSSSAAVTSQPLPALPPELRRGGGSIEGILSLPPTLNPLLADDLPARRLAALLYQGLTVIHPDTHEPAPALAGSWTVEEEGRLYTFRLRDGLVWHDGQPILAVDVLATFQALAAERDLSLRAATLASLLDTVVANDAQTVTVTLKQAYAPFLTELATLPILPAAHVSGPVQGLEGSPAGSQPIGAGPFALVSRTVDRISLRRHPGYWAGPAPLDSLELRRLPSVEALLESLARAEIDLAELPAGWLTAPQLDSLRALPHLTVRPYPGLAVEFLTFQLRAGRHPALTDPRVRRALAYALDRPALVATATLGLGHLPAGTLAPISWAAGAGIEPAYATDPSRAATLLEQAGWLSGDDGLRRRDSQPLTVTLDINSGNQLRATLADGIGASWRRLGVTVITRAEPFPAFVDRILGRGEFDACLLSLDLGVDPDQTALWESRAGRAGYNVNRYSNAQVDRLLATARATHDRNQRRRAYDDLQRLVLSDLPALPLVAPATVLAHHRRLQNLRPTAIDASHGAARWWLAAPAPTRAGHP